MELYKASVKNDDETVIILVSARSAEDAILTIMRAEKCPRSAILWMYSFDHLLEVSHE